MEDWAIPILPAAHQSLSSSAIHTPYLVKALQRSCIVLSPVELLPTRLLFNGRLHASFYPASHALNEPDLDASSNSGPQNIKSRWYTISTPVRGTYLFGGRDDAGKALRSSINLQPVIEVSQSDYEAEP